MVFIIIILIILSVILLTVALLTLPNITLWVSGSGTNAYVYLKYLFFKIKLNKKTFKNKKSSNKKKLKNTKAKNSGNKKSSPKEAIDSVINNLELIKYVVLKVKDVAEYIKVSSFKLLLTITDDDAANAAICYGVACSTVYPTVGILQGLVEVKNPQVNIVCDYDAFKCNCEYNIVLKLRTLHATAFAFRVLLKFIKSKL